jgi:hypothetical protein
VDVQHVSVYQLHYNGMSVYKQLEKRLKIIWVQESVVINYSLLQWSGSLKSLTCLKCSGFL